MRRLVFVGLALAAWCGCGGKTTIPDGGEGTDATAVTDATADAWDGDYQDLTDGRFWSFVDLRSILPADTHLERACFDGRYVYWGGSFPGMARSAALVLRYDTQLAFEVLSSWSVWAFDEKFLHVFLWPISDGRHIYVGLNGGATSAREVRFDTLEAFGDLGALSYSSTLLGGLVKESVSLGPAVFDGRHLYFPAFQASPSGLTLRYDTQGAFGAQTSWRLFDPRLPGALSTGGFAFGGPILVGSHLVLPPMAPGGAAVLYDTRRAFDDAAAWSRVALPPGKGDSVWFSGAGTDGRFVYLVPRDASKSPRSGSGLVVRYDITLPGDADAWQTFDTSVLHPNAKGYGHASWDGRFFYLMVGDEVEQQDREALVVRYDTSKEMNNASSWSLFDMNTFVPPPEAGSVRWSGGVVFDGAHVYIATIAGGLIVRFHARTPPKLPAGFSGTFY